jgi:cytochrome bd ubiquinol oxidase subunit II
MLATIWFCLAALTLTGFVLLDGFDLGAGIVQLFVAKTENDRTQILRSIGPVWDGNEVWLLVLGGGLVLAFPVLYASAFSGFYLALMIVLWLLILRGISIEFHGHVDGAAWRQFWSMVFALASATLALVFGIALGNVIRGVPVDATGVFFLPLWTNLSPFGRVGIIDWFTLLVGVASTLALAIHGSLWVVLKTEGNLQERARSFAIRCWTALLPLMLVVTATSFAIQPNLRRQFVATPWGAVFPALAIAGIIAERLLVQKGQELKAFLASGVSIAGMLTSAAFGLFPNVLPSSNKTDLSLTIYNSATAEHGLAIALWWFIPGMALAIGYSILVYGRFMERAGIGTH